MRLFQRRKPNVPRLRRRGNLDGLRAALRHRETVLDDEGTEWDVSVDTRIAAAEALSHFNGLEVADDLAEALDDPQPEVQLAAVEAISRLGIHVAVERLMDLVVGREREAGEVSARALDLLAEWHVESSPEVFAEKLLQPGSPTLEDRHRHALDRMLAVDPRGAAAHEAVVTTVIATLQEPAKETAEDCAERILRWLGSPAVDRVVEALGDGAAPAVLRMAGRLGDARALDPLVHCLDSTDPEQRRSAALAVGALNHTRAVPELLMATQDSEQSVRDAASAALNRMGMSAVIVGVASLVGAGGDDHAVGRAVDAVLAEGEDGAGEDRAGEDRPDEVTPAAPELHLPPGRRRAGGLVERLLGKRDD